ncbi:Protein of unknown function [Roseivivax lentus]|uniref:DUF3179 domain-containing protein n=1 Tax=Roseivivax lentus TaxID=633194 RepID=A0A1N7L801_9RHOB|nr:DUF3179 domain-containing protein [Roseivivax lentus]SIS69946.1 Protein of unknown function [Roseivivax lentus]
MWKLILAFLCTATLAAADPAFWKHEWPQTDFGKRAIDGWAEIVSGGPGKDGILALSDPEFVPASRKRGLEDKEPVITVQQGSGPARAYPLRYLMWHEIANDRVGGIPVAVTYCPLCNSAIVFDRRVAGDVLSFGVTGKLRKSDMVMYDHQTQSWWQQAEGRAIVGRMTGTRLEVLPSWMESWARFRADNPDGMVMAEPPFNRQYGTNPYRRYDSAARPFLYSGDPPPHGIPPLARVVRVGTRAWPLTRLAEAGRLQEAGLTFTWEAGLASALDTARIGAGRDIGQIRVTDARGRDVAHDLLFAFAFHAFWPDGTWMLGR